MMSHYLGIPVPALITLLGHDDVIARGLSLGTLTHLRDLAAPAVQRLTRLLDEAPIEEDVVSALKAIGPAAASAIPKLLEVLSRRRSSSSEGPRPAAPLPRGVDPGMAEAGQALFEQSQRMSDPDKDSRAEAARALGHLGSTSGAVVAALVEATRDREDTFLCTAAVGALEERAREALPELRRLHRSTPEDCCDRDLLSDAIDAIEGQLG